MEPERGKPGHRTSDTPPTEGQSRRHAVHDGRNRRAGAYDSTTGQQTASWSDPLTFGTGDAISTSEETAGSTSWICEIGQLIRVA